MKKKDVTKGLDPDLFASNLDDDEADNEGDVTPEDSASSTEAEDDSAAAEDTAEEETTEELADVTESTEEAPEDEEEEEEEAEETEEEEEVVVGEDTASVAAAAADDSSELNDETDTYVVQRGFTGEGGKTYHPGNVISVKCKHCALWKREWLGKIRCSPGRRLDENTVMHEDRFSCGEFFICKEFSPELTTFLNMNLAEIVTVRKMIPGIKKILQAPEFLESWVKVHNYSGDTSEAFINAKGFILSFSSEEQLLFSEEFIRQYAKIMTQRSRTKRPPRPKFEAGDWVTWVDSTSKDRVEGIILSIGRGNIYLAGVKAYQTQKFVYKYKEWKSKYKPEITRKTARP